MRYVDSASLALTWLPRAWKVCEYSITT